MKSILLILICFASISICHAEEYEFFMRAEIGEGKTCSDLNEKSNFAYSVRAGVDYHGFQFEAGLHVQGKYDKLYENYHYQSINISTGYDCWRFITKDSRHHLVPYLGAGVSRIYYEEVGLHIITNNDEVVLGKQYNDETYELFAGLRYEYDLNDNWTIGLFAKNIESEITSHVGVSVKYIF